MHTPLPFRCFSSQMMSMMGQWRCEENHLWFVYENVGDAPLRTFFYRSIEYVNDSAFPLKHRVSSIISRLRTFCTRLRHPVHSEQESYRRSVSSIPYKLYSYISVLTIQNYPAHTFTTGRARQSHATENLHVCVCLCVCP